MARGRVLLVLASAAALMVSLSPEPARSDGTPTAGLIARLSGPTSGNVGDTLTFTVTATNNGPDDGMAFVEFAMQRGAGLTPLDWSPACPSLDSPSQWIMQCRDASVPVGGKFQLTVHVHVDAIKETTVDGLAIPDATTDPNTSNNAASFAVFPATPSPPPAPPPPPAATAPPYSLVPTVPPATEDRPYSLQVIQNCDGNNCWLQGVRTSVSGSLPVGMTFGDDGVLRGLPYITGTYTFTIQATDAAKNYLTLTQQYTLIVEPLQQIDTGDAPPSLILPNRSRTPGVTNAAVTQKTIKKTICVSGWTNTIRPSVSYTNTLKLKQMKQYREKGKPSAYEEDQLIPLELGGAPKSPKNLWPEPRSQSKRSDPLETTLERKVCTGTLTLAGARKQIVAFKRIHG